MSKVSSFKNCINLNENMKFIKIIFNETFFMNII